MSKFYRELGVIEFLDAYIIDMRLFALMMVVVSSTVTGLTPRFAGFVPSKRSVGVFRVGARTSGPEGM